MALVLLGVSGPALADDGGDWFSPVVNLNEQIISELDKYVGPGAAVVGFSLLVKIATLPLNDAALRAGARASLIAPQMQYLDLEYKDNDTKRNELLRKLYESVGFDVSSSLSLIVPVLIQLPIFISLFRAVGQLASKDVTFRQPFLWIPDLSGPVEIGSPNLDWLLRTRSSEAFEPLIGWQTASLYLIMPVIVTIVNLASIKMSPIRQDSNLAGTLFPLFVGMSTLVTPQAVGIYWLVNSAVTIAQTTVVQQQVIEEYPEYKRILDEASPGDGMRDTRAGTPEVVKASVRALDPMANALYQKREAEANFTAAPDPGAATQTGKSASTPERERSSSPVSKRKLKPSKERVKMRRSRK